MFTLLVVDDEEYAVMGITQGIDWLSLDITRVLTAGSTMEAEEILTRESVDLVISDIEMPGKSGIDLLMWMQVHVPGTQAIFLTGHANFQYAHKALQYGCSEYLLKPVEYQQLVRVVQKLLKERTQELDRSRLVENYREYKNLWETQKPTFISHLWRDILEGRLPGDSRRIQEMFRALDIPVEPSQQVVLVFIKVEQWLEEMDLRDKEVMRFAVRNVATESLMLDRGGIVFQLQDDSQMAVIYVTDASEPLNRLLKNAEGFIEASNTHLNCHLSCYVAAPAGLSDVSGAYKDLLRLEQENITKPNSVLQLHDFRSLSGSTLKAPDFAEWTILLESGRMDTLRVRIHEFLDRISEGQASKEMLESFCYGVISLIYSILHKSGLQVSAVFPAREKLSEGTQFHSTQQAYIWANGLLDAVHEACINTSRNESSMVREVKNFIENHILQDFSREDIANALHFNADYLSRVFKKETGTVLSDHIIFRRMTMARKLLEESNDRIADIAHSLGYNHFSHFARQFRNIAGMTPQEYRMKHRKLQM